MQVRHSVLLNEVHQSLFGIGVDVCKMRRRIHEFHEPLKLRIIKINDRPGLSKDGPNYIQVINWLM